ncbi:ATP-binding protein [Methylobrevis albus]|nr:ATP-binding protein [Methylobrevis albus]
MALRRLFRTTALKLSLLYLVVFGGLTAFLLGYISYNTTALLSRTQESSISAEIASLTEDYRRGGIRRLVETVLQRSRWPSASLYMVTDFSGRTVVGNVADLPMTVFANSDGTPQPVIYRRLEGDGARDYTAMVQVFQLPGGFRLLVGRDVSEREEFGLVIRDSVRLAIIVIALTGLASWIFVGRRVLKRVEGVAETSRRIVSGDLSRRLDVVGSGDEFDNLAGSLNGMLDRIEQLMVGLKEVSDNVAHDLKTPLTRLRTRLETVLRTARSDADYRAAIETSVEEADALIRTFDALLRIARVEAGSAGEVASDLDAAVVLADVGELYEPVVEDAGGRLELDVEGPLPVHANRALLSQALANLIDNAIKYALPDPETETVRADAPPPRIRIVGRRTGALVHLSVVDEGPGVPEQDRERATQRFVRLDASRSRQGSGLGLSLVAAVARYSGGSFRLADAGPGLAAVIQLPAADEHRPDEKKQGEDQHVS